MSRARLPAKAVRDLIGIVRCLYFVWHDRGVEAGRLEELIAVGRELRDCLDLAQRTEPDTLGHRAAWSRAERATATLGAMIAHEEAIAPVVAAAVKRVGRATRG